MLLEHHLKKRQLVIGEGYTVGFTTKKAPLSGAFKTDGFALADTFFPCLAGTDPDTLLDGENENFSVSDLAGAAGLDDLAHDIVDLFIMHEQLEFDFREEIVIDFLPSDEFPPPLLVPTSHDLGDGETVEMKFA
jgi:hypothetical protein